MGLCLCDGEGFILKDNVKSRFLILLKSLFFFFESLQILIKRKENSKLVELEVPRCLSSPSGPFSKPTSLKMTFIDFHSMRVILQNEDGGVRERNLPGVTRGIGVPPDPVFLYLFCLLYPETCTLGISRVLCVLVRARVQYTNRSIYVSIHSANIY